VRRIYVASSWRNRYQQGVVAYLRALGHEVYDFQHPTENYDNPNGLARGFHWSEIDPDWQQWTPEQYRGYLLTHPLAAQGYASDAEAMEWADTCVLVLPSGRSAHLEAGYFAGHPNKSLHILLQPDREGFTPDLMYLMADGIHLHIVDLWPALRMPTGATA
jgi:hypothetical protein